MDIEDFIDVELGALLIVPVQVNSQGTEEHEDVLEEGYSKDSQQIARFLLTLKKPKGMTQGEFCAFWKCALKYAVIDKQLYQVGLKNVPSWVVIDSLEK